MISDTTSSSYGRNLIFSMCLYTAPLVLIYLYYIIFPNSSLFSYGLDYSLGLPLVTADSSQELSVTFALYCKTAPFLSMFFVWKNRNKIRLKLEGKNGSKIFSTCITSFIFFASVFYIMILLNHELTTSSSKLIHRLSQNDIGVAFIYISSYASAFLLCSISLSILSKAYPYYKLNKGG